MYFTCAIDVVNDDEKSPVTETKIAIFSSWVGFSVGWFDGIVVGCVVGIVGAGVGGFVSVNVQLIQSKLDCDFSCIIQLSWTPFSWFI